MTARPFGLAGTPEGAWRTWAAPRHWPALDAGRPGRAVVASPHPDDETLGVGGTIWLLRRRGWDVTVVAVTDGERSHPPAPHRPTAALATLRRAEQVAALGHLGLDAPAIERLGLPDGAVAACEDALVGRLADRLGPGAWLVAPWARDGHRDHDAVGRAAARAATATGSRLLSYPVWAWHRLSPGAPAVAAWRGVRVDLPPAARRAKATALARYRSQLHGLDDHAGRDVVVPPAVAAHHRRPWEVLLT